MPTHIIILVQDHKYEVIKPVAFLSEIIEKKYNERKSIDSSTDSGIDSGIDATTSAGIILEDISHEAFDKFIEFSEIYFGMSSDEKSTFTKDTYAKMYGKSKHYKWMNEIYNDLTNEQILSLAVLAEKLSIKFLIHYLGYKLSDHIDDDRFFKE